MSAGADAPGQRARFAYVGCFTTAERRARGDGLRAFAIGAAGNWTPIQHVSGLINPSFLVMGTGERTLYAVHGDRDYATALARDAHTGALRTLNRASTGGNNVVHGALDAAGKHFVVANYGTGSVAVLPVGGDGSLGDHTQCVAMPGTPGPHRSEQASSHPHQVVFDPSGRYVLVPDKGHDAISVFAFDPARGTLELASVVGARPGAGPRHGAFHPTRPIYWCLNELDSSITTFRWSVEDGTLEPMQILPTLPPDFFGASTAAAIVATPSGAHVFVSNRGHDSIAAFAVDADTGRLEPIGWTRAPGREPRFMTLRDGVLYVASERDDIIGRMVVDAVTGALRPTEKVTSTPSPVSIVFG